MTDLPELLGNLSVAELNPLRYRGYYYDTETGFYYLQSRYYDPALGRFINGDSYASTGQGYLGYNMFAYCNNNPVMSYDPTGHSNEAYYEWMLGAGGGSAMAGVGLVAAGVALTSGGGRSLIDTVCSGVKKCATALAYAAKKLATTAADIVSPKPAAVPATRSVAIAQEKVETKKKQTITIYRYRSTKTKNLVPRSNTDYDGLSFSLIPPTSSQQFPAVVTTIDAVEATGILTTVQRGNHVSIVPTNGTVEDWMDQGKGSCWTLALSAIVVKVGK